MRLFLTLSLLHVLVAGIAVAQEPRTENTLKRGPDFRPAPTKIDAMNWLAGRWVGSAMGGSTEEIWSPPQHGEMIGMFRFNNESPGSFYEFMTIAEKDDSLVLRVKHFDADFKGWEAPDKFVEFGFLAQRDQKMYFDGLTFAPQGDGRMAVYVANESKGKYSELKFEFTRQDNASASGSR